MGKAMKRERKKCESVSVRWAQWISRMPLRRAFFVYALIYLLISIALISGTILFCDSIRTQIIEEEISLRMGFNGDRVGMEKALTDTYIYVTILPEEELEEGIVVSAADQNMLYTGLGFLQIFCVAAWPIVCLSLAGRRFYRRKLREPLQLLRCAALRIGQNDLDFSLRYDAQDELGRLCADFETMRAGVLAHEREMWRAIAERRRQTAALEHDLRTPLTVLKGQTELLEASAERVSPPKLRESMHTMRSHIERMERYIQGLSQMSSLEDETVRREPVQLHVLADMLADTGEMLCRQKGVAFVMQEAQGMAPADAQLVARVFDNLVKNAARYAADRVTAAISCQNGRLMLIVQDDGPGFSPKALVHGTDPFYSESKTGVQGHLGLGLNIARVLCELCGGGLTLANAPEGGAMVTADFGIVEKS